MKFKQVVAAYRGYNWYTTKDGTFKVKCSKCRIEKPKKCDGCKTLVECWDEWVESLPWVHEPKPEKPKDGLSFKPTETMATGEAPIKTVPANPEAVAKPKECEHEWRPIGQADCKCIKCREVSNYEYVINPKPSLPGEYRIGSQDSKQFGEMKDYINQLRACVEYLYEQRGKDR